MRIALKARRYLRIWVGGLVILAVFLIAVLGEHLAPYNPIEQDIPHRLQPPSSRYPFGTDTFGRDILSRMIVGSRATVAVAVAAAVAGLLVGALMGLVSAYFGGWVDLVCMRIVDALLCFPTLLLAMVVVAVLGSGIPELVLALTISGIPRYARIGRGAFLLARAQDYVESARSLGAGHMRIMFKHILPNSLSPLVVASTFMLATAISSEASLGFLGLGIPRPAPTWGNILNEGFSLLRLAPWVALIPAATIVVVIFCLNMLGDGLRDALDPRLKNQ